MPVKTQGYVTMLLLAVVWSSYYVANKAAAGHLHPFHIGIVIRTFTWVALTAILLGRGRLAGLFGVGRKLPWLLLIGALGFLLDISAFAGLRYSTATNAAILLKTDVLFTYLISITFFRERIHALGWAALGLMLAGVLLVMKADLRGFAFNGIGDLLIVLSAFFITCNAFVIKHVQTSPGPAVADETVAYYNNFITGLLFTVVAGAGGMLGGLGAVFTVEGVQAPLLIAGTAQTTLYLLYYYNLRRSPVWLVKLLLLLIPCFGAVESCLFLGERVDLMQVLGMVVVMVGAAIIILQQRGQPLGRSVAASGRVQRSAA